MPLESAGIIPTQIATAPVVFRDASRRYLQSSLDRRNTSRMTISAVAERIAEGIARLS
jgi:hypothetical protein